MDWLMNNAGSKFSSLLKKYKGAFDGGNYGGGGGDNGSSSSACHSHQQQQQHHFRLSEPPLRKRTINDHHHQDHSSYSKIRYDENLVSAKEQDSKECSLKLVDSQNRKFSILVHDDESYHFYSNIPAPARSPSNIELIINQFTDQDYHSPIRRKSTLTPNFDTENVNASESIIDQSLAARDPSFRDLKLIYDQLPNPSAAKRKTLCDCAGQVTRKSALPKYSPNPLMRRNNPCCHHHPTTSTSAAVGAGAANRHLSTRECSSPSPSTSTAASTRATGGGGKPKAAGMVALRLRFMLHQLEMGSLNPNDLKKNLEYACMVLEAAYVDDPRKLLDDDEDYYEEFAPDEMPTEVRDWLASTFTRRTSNRNKKLKFKSVANAIRSGIAFDRIFRRISLCPQIHIPPEINDILKDINSWEFDIFKLNEISENKSLKYVGLLLFNSYSLLTRFKISVSTLEAFLHRLEVGYSKFNNPYHNLIHAADVTQTAHWLLSQTGLIDTMSEVETYACLFAALIHDFEHTGQTNNFHLQSLSDFAILYNDRSILENHHVSAVFRFMREDADCNILTSLTKEEFKEFRSLVIEIVLSTDMSMHFGQLKAVKSMINSPDGVDKVRALSLIVHSSDISHPAKLWNTHSKWTMLVLEEFFRQGDLELSLGLPYSPLCDRNSTHVAESQIGFIDFIVEPCFLVCTEMLTKLLDPYLQLSNYNQDSIDDHRLSVASGSEIVSPVLSPRIPKRLPVTADGKLDLPKPYMKILHDNKAIWKERSAAEDKQMRLVTKLE